MIKANKKSQRKLYIRIKSCIDVFISIFLIIFSLPIFTFLIILVKFSSRGPIFFYQKRLGRNKKIFHCIKFRTMHPEAEDLLENLLRQNDEIRNEFKKNHKLKNDPRITPIGFLLRKTSLDELPQLFNVLKMEMSLIGPRPIVKEEQVKYGNAINKVLSVKPGITGLWQVSGRNNLSYERRVKLDLLYSRDLNLLMDLRILLRTFGVLFFPKDRGAY
jgi:lipopolysaccharide/colanic/teichoic acid biosynthesis glycosyltransferase